MELQEIERHAKALMTLHGVGRLEFAFDNGKKRIGATWFKNVSGYRIATKITLSRHFAAILTDEEIRETILHEIAHALAGHEAGHGPKWKAHARALGIKGDRCKSASAKVEPSVKAYCPCCQQPVGGYHRLPLRVKWHAACPAGNKIGDRGHALKWFKGGRLVPLNQMPSRYQEEFNRKK